MTELTQKYVRSLFDYRDGELYWKKSRSNVHVGDLAGTVKKDGYRAIQTNGKVYLAHRLIFLYHHGYLPEFLDHIDGNKLNNSISNLRGVTNQENLMNQKKRKYYGGKLTSSWFKGVFWNKLRQKWVSQITINRKRKHLGYFISEIEAALAYDKAAIELFGKYAKPNFDRTNTKLYKVLS